MGRQEPDGKIGPPNSDNRVVLRGFGRINAACGFTARKKLRDWALISPGVGSECRWGRLGKRYIYNSVLPNLPSSPPLYTRRVPERLDKTVRQSVEPRLAQWIWIKGWQQGFYVWTYLQSY